MTSDATPITNNTPVRRRCSSSSVPISLKSGTTTDSRGPADPLRDMTNAPSGGVREIVSDELEPFDGDARARFHAAQQLELGPARIEQPRPGCRQRGVDVARMNHQFGDAGAHHRDEPPERGSIEHAGMN